MEWKDQYPRNKKPAYSELLAYLPEDIRDLFLRFDKEMNEKFTVFNRWQRYDKNAGWIYGYCRNYRFELLNVTIRNDCFIVSGVPVRDEESLLSAIDNAEKAYAGGFEAGYEALCAKRRTDQIERTKKRLECEKKQTDMLMEQVDPKKFNQFKWCKKVSRRDLLRLYQSEAKGMVDEDLLDDVGITFYTRCTQAKKARALMEKGQMLCFQCGAVLQANSYTGLTECSCGTCYTYREYRRSCNAADMPGGRAAPVFENFIQQWPNCRDAASKMMLIDRLIHECHVTLMSGIKGRSVCVNLIEGTKKQISDVIMQLAYGGSDAGTIQP